MPTAEQLSRLLAPREARASVALDGQTQHIPNKHHDCCIDHARERIAGLEAECERLRELGLALVREQGPQRIECAHYTKGGVRRDPHWECSWCSGRPLDYDDESPANIDHAESCLADPKRWGLEWNGVGWEVSDGATTDE